MLPIVNNHVRPWWERHGATMTDKTTLAHMIAMAERDIASLENLMPEYREKAPDLAAEGDVELIEARVLVALIRRRLADLEQSRG